MICKICKKGVKKQDTSKAICCVTCNQFFHISCVVLKDEDIQQYESQENSWECEFCKNLNKSKAADTEKSVTEYEKHEVSVKDVYKLLVSLSNEVKELKRIGKDREVDLGKSLDLAHEKLDANMELLQKHTDIIDACMQEVEQLKIANNNLHEENIELRMKLIDLEQYSRVNMVEIHGVPVKPAENTFTVVQDVGRVLGLEIKDEFIDACHRLKSRSDTQVPAIIVKFTHRRFKEDILKQRRVKRNLNTLDLGYNFNNPVYINESLCSDRRKLLAKAREARRLKNAKYVWTRNGNVFLRLHDHSPIFQISNEIDVTKFIESH